MQEIWKPVKNYENLYEVSNTGKIKSLSYNHCKTQKIMKPTINSAGYYKVELYKNGKSNIFYVHRLVSESFIENPNNYPCVNHIDCDKTNNNVYNLEWVTYKQNTKHAIKNGLFTPAPLKGKHGKYNPNCKSILQYDTNGNFIKLWYSATEAAKFFNCKSELICACLRGRNKTSKGFMWKYYNGGEIPLKISPLKK